MTPLSLLWEITLLRTTTPPLATWDDLLPDQAKRLPDELARIDAYLDDERFLAPWRAHFHARLGRPSVPVPTLLRLLYLKHRYGLGYESLCKEVSDSISWRRVCRIPLDRPVPHPTTLSKLVRRAGPSVLDPLKTALPGKPHADKLLRGRKLRVDTTVVEADIDYPTDADLLEQAVRKLGRLVRRSKAHGAATRTTFQDRSRAGGRRLKQLSHALRRRGAQAGVQLDRRTAEIATLARQTLRQVEAVRRNARRTLAGRPGDGRHPAAAVAERPAACRQPGDPRSAGVAGRPRRPPDPQRQAAASHRVRLHPAAGRRRTRLCRRPPAAARQPTGRATAAPGSGAGGPAHRSPGRHGGRRPRVRHRRQRPSAGRAWRHAGRGAAQGQVERDPCPAGADQGVPAAAQLAGRDRGADQPPQALVRAAAHPPATPCWRHDLGRAGGARLQPAAHDRGDQVNQASRTVRRTSPCKLMPPTLLSWTFSWGSS